MLRFGLGQATPPPCSAGFHPAPAACPNYTDYKIVSDPNGSGCQRCDPKTSADTSDETCIRAVQYYFQQQGQLPLAAVTGQWNDQTRGLLNARFGPSWQSFPGGACGILASLGTGIAPTGQYPPGYNPYAYPPATSSNTTALLAGGGVLLLILLLAKR